MYQSQRQRFRHSDAQQARNGPAERSPRGALLLLPAVLVAVLGGCASDGQMTDPSTYLGNPFKRPTEAGFQSMVQANCGSMSIGDETVNGLLGQDTAFDGWVAALYNGDISNDEFMNQVLLQHPAPDANVPAAGCIMDQLAECFAETCQVQTAAEREKMAQKNMEAVEEIETTVTIDPSELPSKDAAEVDQLVESSKEDEPKPLP